MKNVEKQLEAFLENHSVTVVVSALIVVYMTFYAGQLTELKDFFGTWYGKLVTLALIVFLAHHNVPLGVMVALLFVTEM